MLDQKAFSECIDDNSKMVANICAKTTRQLGDHFDMLLITREEQAESILLTGFDADDGGCL